MILRALAIAVGLGLLAATAHISIAQSGGYGTPHSFIVLAVAAGVGVGALTIGVAWSERRHGLALAILVALLCGEAWGLLATSERIIASREQIQAPLRDRAAQHRSAVAAMKVAESAKPVLADRARLLAAQSRKQTADEAARAAATDKNCRDNCRLLLQAAVDAAFAEISAARNEIATHDLAQTSEINARIQMAAQALREAPMPTSAAPLADRLGLPAWTLDLVTAALGSIAANGLAACMLAFGVHRRRLPAFAPAIPLAAVAIPREMPRPAPQLQAPASEPANERRHDIVNDEQPAPQLLLAAVPSRARRVRPVAEPTASEAPVGAPAVANDVAPAAASTVAAPAANDGDVATDSDMSVRIDAAHAGRGARAAKAGTGMPKAQKTGDVMAFAVAQLYPDVRGTILLTTAHSAYRQWCGMSGYQPVEPGEFADEFAQIVRKLKLTAQMSPQGLVIRGAMIPQIKSSAA
jgi:hypothetical protein